ncbi:hypothetical protein [Frigoriglobus tundricola]|uniref:Uncharacterized protein n=1 Tax=Frigoriglobus tundricola TaxID=2774151 RepID=A0A6M5YXS0_9BACT|nr:hypothetical protein [Frigoriglobus tundricola]QJW98698.1 hypothetical protein FTUN_6293 [Frigoriglobus tundricola]
MRALLIALLILPAGCKKSSERSDGDSSAGTAALESAGVIGGNDLADAWEADGANRAKVKEQFFGKRWTIDLCENLNLETDHVAIRVHSNRRWVTTRIYFRDPKEIAAIDWIGSNKKVRVNALCKDEFTFTDAVLGKWSPIEAKKIEKDKKVMELKNKIFQQTQELEKLHARVKYTNSISYQTAEAKRKVLDELKEKIAKVEAELKPLEEALKAAEAE